MMTTKLRIVAGYYFWSTYTHFFRPDFLKVKGILAAPSIRETAIEEGMRRKGLFLEFGVHQGNSLNYFAKKVSPKKIYGFDSFRGLNRAWGREKKWAFNLNGKAPKVEPNVVIVNGMFKDTLPNFSKKHAREHIAFVHVDCDLYESTRDVFNCLGERLDLHNTIVLFDEFYNYKGWEVEEYKAFNEFLSAFGYKAKYLAYNSAGQQVMAKII